ncbi:unnamed protein product [Vitrella brassicaformis CCMP3155]|uniref:Uncharacterized protein n=1 Tax=Vitrella brassicaformis (strain CCMP3155) TaxID=1169540 RepID=A0A0G4H4J6_VITBC|nr:unnamed protein product [Vitrella brassicaformis CCMP3155]|eukprot:CEM38702.1 unnamed protein product [Vitrella brassicaformis CCMP3155]
MDAQAPPAPPYRHRPRAGGVVAVQLRQKDGQLIITGMPKHLFDDLKAQMKSTAQDETLAKMISRGWDGLDRYGGGLGAWLKRHHAAYLPFVPTMAAPARSTLPRNLSDDELQQLVDEAHLRVPGLGMDPVSSVPSVLRLARGEIEHEVLMALESEEPFPLLRSLGLEDLLLSNHAQYSSKIPGLPPASSRRRRRDSGDDDDVSRPSKRGPSYTSFTSLLPAVAPSRQPKRKGRSPAVDPAFPQISSPPRKVRSPERDKGGDVAAAAAAARGRSASLSPQPMEEDPPPPRAAAAAAAAASVVMPKAAPARPPAAAPAANQT